MSKATERMKLVEYPSSEDESERSEVETEDLGTDSSGGAQNKDSGTKAGEDDQAGTLSLCGMCKMAPKKYTCPGCHLVTCSLACVRKHKEVYGCDGKRSRTHYVPMKNYTSAHFFSDYALIEEATRITDNAIRLSPANAASQQGRRKRKRQGPPQQQGHSRQPSQHHPLWEKSCNVLRHLSPRWQLLAKEAQERNVMLIFMPQGLSRRSENSSIFVKKSSTIHWRVELQLGEPGSTNAFTLHHRLTDKSIPETMTLHAILQKHFDPASPSPATHLLRQRFPALARTIEAGPARNPAATAHAPYLYWKRHDAHGDRARPYQALGDLSMALRDVLRGRTVVEYPTIHVSPAPLHAAFVHACGGEEAVGGGLEGGGDRCVKEEAGEACEEEACDEAAGEDDDEDEDTSEDDDAPNAKRAAPEITLEAVSDALVNDLFEKA